MSIVCASPASCSLSTLSLLAQSDGGLSEAAGRLGNTPYWVLGCYLVLLLVLGIVGWWKSSAGEEDYYLAGREQGWLVSSLTIMATFFSSFALLGAPGLVYKEGVALALFSLNVPVAGLSVYLLGGRIWKLGRKLGYVTPGDMAADYYGSRLSLRLLVALSGFLYAIPYVVMQIQAGGILSQKLFGEDSFEAGAILLAAITTLYIMIGGMRSVAWTDLVQGLLLISGMLVCGFAMLLLFGGPAEFSRRVVTELPDSSLTIPGNSGGWPWPQLFTVCLLASVGSMVQPAQWMRFYSARNLKTLKRGAVIFAAVLTTCFIVGVMLIGIAGQVLYPLQFHYAAAVSGESASGETVTLNQPVPADLQEQFQVVYTAPEAAAVIELRWTWQGNQFAPMTEDDVRRLRGLSGDPGYLAALDELQQQVSTATSRPAVLPNPRVDPDPSPPDFDSILVVVLQDKLPDLLHGFGAVFASLVIVAIMAASMSTADSNLHALSAVLTRDVYDQYLRPQSSERERVWVGRIVILAATVLALAAVILGRDPEFSSRYEVMTMIGKLGLMAIAFSAQVLPMTIDMLYLNRGTGKGAAAGLAAGLFVAFLFGPLFQMLVDSTGLVQLKTCLNWINAVKGDTMVHGSVWGLAVNVPVFVLVSLVTRGPREEKVRQYRELLNGER